VVERQGLTGRRTGVDYCLSDGEGSATLWSAPPNTDVDADGTLDAVGLDLDGDGTIDDMLADIDDDGIADHAIVDGTSYFTDDGSGTWAVGVDRAGQLRLLDIDGDGLADRALGDGVAYVDTDGDGRWDIKLTDSNDDGNADVANDL
jgi:hypothetical protein